MFFVSTCPTPATLAPLNEIPVVCYGVTKKNFKAKLQNIKKCIQKPSCISRNGTLWLQD